MVTLATVHRSNRGNLIHDPCLLGQVFTDLDSGQGCLGDTKRTPVFIGTVRLGIPGIQVAWSARHPEQDDTLACPHPPATGSRLGPLLEQSGQREPGEPGKAGFQHAPAVEHHQAFTLPSMKAGESMIAMLEYRATGHRWTFTERPRPLRC
jgi:hypothetical protein